MELNLPTYLTLLRIALIPVMVVLFYLPIADAHAICAAIFALAGATDWLDGYLARRMDLATRFGAFLDPVADKLMVVSALLLILQADPTALNAIAITIIVGREITITSLREWMAEVGERKKVEVSNLGKWKTTAQMASIVVLLLAMDVWRDPLLMVGQILLWLSALLTLWSMTIYLRAAVPVFHHADRKDRRLTSQPPADTIVGLGSTRE